MVFIYALILYSATMAVCYAFVWSGTTLLRALQDVASGPVTAIICVVVGVAFVYTLEQVRR